MWPCRGWGKQLADLSPTYLLVDANVLIDYVKSERTVLTSAARHVGTVYVLTAVIDEVTQLDAAECERMGLRVVEPSLSQLATAAGKRGRLSYQDHLCLVLARENGWTCVTNDGALRKACSKDDVPVLWGLEIMVELVAAGHLEIPDAIAVAESIHQLNPFHISEDIVARFAARLRSSTSNRR
jgi:predicted nucleic acid-binding protein